MTLIVHDLVSGYSKKALIGPISLELKAGELIYLLGPNGIGKTTLIKTLLGFVKLNSGKILINGRNISHFTRVEVAKVMGYVPQVHQPPFPFTVMEVVVMGRSPYIGPIGSPSKLDYDFSEQMLDLLGIWELRHKFYTEISGGERQLVLLARALVQQPQLLMMDEPTSHLDFGNQVKVLSHISRLVESGIGVIMTSHNPDHAFLCATKVAVMKSDRTIEVGTPEQMITEQFVYDTYQVQAKIIHHTRRVCIPMTYSN